MLCVLTLSAKLDSNIVDPGCDIETACNQCQRTAYELKFNFKTSCQNSHCQNTCYKVSTQWSQPGSVFEAFLSDNIGKCDACFRAGYCTMTICNDQKRKEQTIIEQSVDHANFTGMVDTKPIDEMMKKILNNEEVNYPKYAKKVKKQIKKDLKAKKYLKDRQPLSTLLSGLLNVNENNLQVELELIDDKKPKDKKQENHKNHDKLEKNEKTEQHEVSLANPLQKTFKKINNKGLKHKAHSRRHLMKFHFQKHHKSHHKGHHKHKAHSRRYLKKFHISKSHHTVKSNSNTKPKPKPKHHTKSRRHLQKLKILKRKAITKKGHHKAKSRRQLRKLTKLRNKVKKINTIKKKEEQVLKINKNFEDLKNQLKETKSEEVKKILINKMKLMKEVITKKINSASIKLKREKANHPKKNICKRNKKKVKKVVKKQVKKLKSIKKEIKKLTHQLKKANVNESKATVDKVLKKVTKKAKNVKAISKKVRKVSKVAKVTRIQIRKHLSQPSPQSKQQSKPEPTSQEIENDKRSLDQKILKLKEIREKVRKMKGPERKKLINESRKITAESRVLARKIYKKIPVQISVHSKALKHNEKKVKVLVKQLHHTKDLKHTVKKINKLVRVTKRIRRSVSKTKVRCGKKEIKKAQAAKPTDKMTKVLKDTYKKHMLTKLLTKKKVCVHKKLNKKNVSKVKEILDKIKDLSLEQQQTIVIEIEKRIKHIGHIKRYAKKVDKTVKRLGPILVASHTKKNIKKIKKAKKVLKKEKKILKGKVKTLGKIEQLNNMVIISYVKERLYNLIQKTKSILNLNVQKADEGIKSIKEFFTKRKIISAPSLPTTSAVVESTKPTKSAKPTKPSKSDKQAKTDKPVKTEIALKPVKSDNNDEGESVEKKLNHIDAHTTVKSDKSQHEELKNTTKLPVKVEKHIKKLNKKHHKSKKAHTKKENKNDSHKSKPAHKSDNKKQKAHPTKKVSKAAKNVAHKLKSQIKEDKVIFKKNVEEIKTTIKHIKDTKNPEERNQLLKTLEAKVTAANDTKLKITQKIEMKNKIAPKKDKKHHKKAKKPLKKLRKLAKACSESAKFHPNQAKMVVVSIKKEINFQKDLIRSKVKIVKSIMLQLRKITNPEEKRKLLKNLKKSINKIKQLKKAIKNIASTVKKINTKIKVATGKSKVALEVKGKVDLKTDKQKTDKPKTHKPKTAKTKTDKPKSKKPKSDKNKSDVDIIREKNFKQLAKDFKINKRKIKKVLKIPKKATKKVIKVMKKITNLAKQSDKNVHKGETKQRLDKVAIRLDQYLSNKSLRIVNMISYIKGIKDKLDFNNKVATRESIQNSVKVIDELLKKLEEGRKTLLKASKDVAEFHKQIDNTF